MEHASCIAKVSSIFHLMDPPKQYNSISSYLPPAIVCVQLIIQLLRAFECAHARESRQTILPISFKHVLSWAQFLLWQITMMALPDGIWTPQGNVRTLQRQQNLFYLELEVIVRSQIEVVPTTIYTYKAHFTKESQDTVHLDFLKCQWLRTTESSSKHNL